LIPPDEIRLITANLHYGGIDARTGDDTDLRTTIAALKAYQPTIAGLQEVDTPNPRNLWSAAHHIANELGMRLVLGPSAAMGAQTGGHTAILVRTADTGIQITSQWPAHGAAGLRASWCNATLQIPGRQRPLEVYSVHLPARSSVDQLRHAQAICSFITEHDKDAFVVGDFNNYPRRGHTPTPGELAALPKHLRHSRMNRLEDGTLAADYRVDDAFVVDAELVDLAAEIAERDGQPERLMPTGDAGARIDRCYSHQRWAVAAASWEQIKIGSDHDAVGVTFILREVTA
jgi:endonuclease/exonuclease/phosphatase family metal-dependent hydrolase